jgi:hypothetical protein
MVRLAGSFHERVLDGMWPRRLASDPGLLVASTRCGILRIAGHLLFNVSLIVSCYLLHKIDGTQGTLMCVPVSMDPIVANAGGGRPPCGQPMPDGSPMAEPILRDLVRRWIAQGAPNN